MALPDKRDRISHRAPRLLWQQVYDDVMNDIRSGALAVDDRLPSELEMAEQYGVSRDVIRRAKEELRRPGMADRPPRSRHIHRPPRRRRQRPARDSGMTSSRESPETARPPRLS